MHRRRLFLLAVLITALALGSSVWSARAMPAQGTVDLSVQNGITDNGPFLAATPSGYFYDVTVTNFGDAVATSNGSDLTVALTVTGGLTITSATGTGWTCTTSSCALNNGETIAANGGTRTFRVNVAIDPNPTPTVSLQAVVAFSSDTNAANDSFTKVTSVVGVPDLQVTKTLQNPPLVHNNEARFLIQVRNNGTTTTINPVILTDNAGTSNIISSWESTDPRWSCTLNSPINTILSCLFNGQIFSGQPAPDLIVKTLPQNPPPSTTPVNLNGNTVTVTTAGEPVGTTGDNSASAPGLIYAQPDLAITKTADADWIALGTNRNFTISIVNNGGQTFSGPDSMVVVDDVPAGLAIQSVTSSAFTCTTTGQQVRCTRTAAYFNGNPPLTITITVRPDVVGNYTNTAIVTTAYEQNLANNSGTVNFPVRGIDVAISKDLAGILAVGNTSTYTLTVSNISGTTYPGLGTRAVSGSIVINDTLPAELVFVAGTLVFEGDMTTWSCTTPPNNNPPQTIACTSGADLQDGQTALIRIGVRARTSGIGATNVTNVANMTVTSDGNTSNNTGTHVFPGPIPAADMVLSDTPTGQTPNPFVALDPNSRFTFTISNNSASNATASAANPITLEVTFPAGVTAANLNASTGTSTIDFTTATCAFVAPTLTCTATAGNIRQTFPESVEIRFTAPNAVNFSVNVKVRGGLDPVDPADEKNYNFNVNAPDLAIFKTHTGTFPRNVSRNIRITVRNVGSAPTVGDITVTDTLPTGMRMYLFGTNTLLAGTGWTTASPDGANAPVFTYAAALAPGAETSFEFQAYASDLTPLGTVVNTANVTNSAEPPTLNGNNTATDNLIVEVAPTADLTVTHSCVPSTIAVGSNTVCTITVQNTGIVATQAGTHTLDTVINSAGLSYVTNTNPAGWVGGVTGTPGVFQWTSTNVMNPGDSAQWTLTLQGTAIGTFNVDSNVSTTGTENNTTNNSASTPITVQAAPQPDLAVTMSHVGNFISGTPGEYLIRVQNVGSLPFAGTAVSMTTVLPAELAYSSTVSATNWTCVAAPPNDVTCTRNAGNLNLAASAFYDDIRISVTVGAAGNYTPGASITVTPADGNATNNNATDPTIVTGAAQPDLSITQPAHGPFTVNVQGTFTVTVQNIGSGPTTQPVVIQKRLPSGFAVVAGNGGNSFTCNQQTIAGFPTAVCTRNLAIPASSGPLNVTISVTPSASGTFPDTSASVAATAPDVDANPANNTAAAGPNIVVNGVPDLIVGKTEEPAGNFLLSNGTGAYRITVTNVGSGATSGTITITDTLPAIMNYNSVSGAGVSCSGTTTVTCTSSSVIAGSGGTLSFLLTVNLTGTGTVTNNVTVVGGGDTTPSGGSDTTTVDAAPTPSLTVTKTEQPAGNFQISNGTGTYRISVTNLGTGPTDGSTITVVDTLPGGMTYSSVFSPAFTCSGTTTVTCTSTAIINPGAANGTFIDLTVSLAGVTPGTYTNNVTVIGGGDTTSASGSDTTTVDPGPQPDLTVDKVGPASFAIDSTGQYTITVTNIGAAPTSGTITVTDTLPAQLTYVSGTGTSGFTCTGTQTAGATVTCTTSTVIAVSGTATITLNVTPNTQGVSVINTATVSGGGEFNTANNSDSTGAIPISGAPDLSITKSLTTGTFLRQNVNGSFNLTVQNGTGAATTGATITVTDTLPASLQFVSATGGGFACTGAQTTGATVTCTRNSVMNISEVGIITLTVRPVTAGFFSNTATVAGGGEPANLTGNNSSSLSFEVRATNPGEPGSVSTYTISPASAPANGTTALTLTITIFQLDNVTPAPNTTVTLQPATTNGLTFSPGLTGTTNSSGQVTFTVVSTVAQTVSVPYSAVNSFSSSGAVTYGTNPPQLVFTSATAGVVSSVRSTVTTDYISIPADGTTVATITVTLKNDTDQPITGKTVTLTANPSPSTLIVTPVSGTVSDAAGQVKFTVRSTAQGSAVFSASVSDNPVVFISQTVTITFTAPGTQPVAAPNQTPGTGTPSNLLDVPTGPIEGRVIAYRLRVRQGPGLDFPIIGLLKLSTRVSIIARNARGTWYQIELQTGTAWVSAAWVRVTRANYRRIPVIDSVPGTAPLIPIPSPLIPVTGQGIGVVNTYLLRVRTGPGLDYQQIGLVKLGTEVLLLGRSPDRRWYQIQIEGGTAWVSSAYIRVRRINGNRLPTIEPPPLP